MTIDTGQREPKRSQESHPVSVSIIPLIPPKSGNCSDSPLKNSQHNDRLRHPTNPSDTHPLRNLHRRSHGARSPQKRHRTLNRSEQFCRVPFRTRIAGGDGEDVS
jgi:hypothetical protein